MNVAKPGHRGVRRALALAALAGSLALSGCVAVQDIDDEEMSKLPPIELHPTPVPTPPPAVMTDIVIMDLQEAPGPDPSLVRLTGTIVNRSKEDAVRLQVRVEARDSLGRVLSRVIVPAATDVVPPNTASSFEASLPRSPSIHDYHAEIVAR